MEEGELLLDYELMGDEGIIIKTGLYPKKDDFKSTSTRYYDAQLNLQWEANDAHTVKHDSKEVMMNLFRQFEDDEKRCHGLLVTPDRKQVVSYQTISGVEITLIDLKTGEKKDFAITETQKNRFYKYRCFIRNESVAFFRVLKKKGIQEGRVYELNFSSGEVKEFVFNLPDFAAKAQNWEETQMWQGAGVGKNGFYFRSNKLIIDKAVKKQFRQEIIIDRNGKLTTNTTIEIGTKITDDIMLGEIRFNPFGKERTFGFALSKERSGKHLSYSCYNADLGKEWKVKSKFSIDPGMVKGSINLMSFNQLSNGAIKVVWSYAGNVYQAKISDYGEMIDEALIEGRDAKCDQHSLVWAGCSTVRKLKNEGGSAAAIQFARKEINVKVKQETFFGVNVSDKGSIILKSSYPQRNTVKKVKYPFVRLTYFK